MLGYLTTFPVSIILNYHTVMMYKTLFRHLFSCKSMERQLSSGWQDQCKRKWLAPRKQSGPSTPSSRTSPSPASEMARFENRIGVLRHAMLTALRHAMLYMSVDVIERRFKQMELRIAAAKTVRQVMDVHVEFLAECCKECMITEEPVIAVSELASWFRSMAS